MIVFISLASIYCWLVFVATGIGKINAGPIPKYDGAVPFTLERDDA